MLDTRHVIVFGGPNGSGKTSLIYEVKQSGLRSVSRVYSVPEYFINPDQVAKDLIGDFPDQQARDRHNYYSSYEIEFNQKLIVAIAVSQLPSTCNASQASDITSPPEGVLHICTWTTPKSSPRFYPRRPWFSFG